MLLISVSDKASLGVMNSLSFYVSGKVPISSPLKDSFAGWSVLDWQIFFSQHFEFIIPISPDLLDFCSEICSQSYGDSLVCDVFLFSFCFSNSLLDFEF